MTAKGLTFTSLRCTQPRADRFQRLGVRLICLSSHRLLPIYLLLYGSELIPKVVTGVTFVHGEELTQQAA